MVQRIDGKGEDETRDQREPRGGHQEVAAVRDQGSPFGGRRRGAETEEAEARGNEDRHSEVERRENKDRSRGVRQDVHAQHAAPSGAAEACGLDIGQGLYPHHLDAHRPREPGYQAKADRNRDGQGAEADGRDDRQREEEPGQGKQHVDEAHQGRIDAPADEARGKSDEHAADRGDPDGEQGGRD